MAHERKKHKILEYLIEIGREPTDPSDYSKGFLNPSKIYSKFKYESRDVDAAMGTLMENKHIYAQYNDLNGNLYRITDKGKVAYNEKYYLSKLWSTWSQRITFGLSIIAIVISIIALFLSQINSNV